MCAPLAVYVWGRTREGQCAVTNVTPVDSPTFLSSLAHEHASQIACGADVTYVVTSSGALYQFGAVHAPSDALAHADLAGYGRSLSNLSEANQSMLRASVASYLAAGDEEDNNEHEGEAGEGEEGGAAAESATVGTRRVLSPDPTRVQLGAGERASHVAGGFGFGVVLLSGGGALSFGLNDRFQCGHGDRVTRDAPTRVASLHRIPLVAVACGQQHACVADEHGQVYTWGMGAFGQLGHGRRRDEVRPRHVMLLAEAGAVVAIACGQQHTAFVVRPKAPSSEEGEEGGDGGGEGKSDVGRVLFGCGHAEYGQLGTGDHGGAGEAARDFPLPRRIPMPEAIAGEVVDVSCGALHTSVLTSLGECATFGWGASGALGHGGFFYELEARPVALLGTRRVSAISAGGRHSLALEQAESHSSNLARDLGEMLASAIDADVVLQAGRQSGVRRFLAHRCVLAARCPRLLAMIAFSTSRFALSHASTELPALHWPSQATAGGQSASCAAVRLPAIRAPIFGLLLTWVYTDRIDSTETLFLHQLTTAAIRLGIPVLADACERALRQGDGNAATGAAGRGSDAVPPAVSLGWSLPSRLGWLLEDGAYAQDLRLIATDGDVYASRALLCSRCEYFRTLLHGALSASERAGNGAEEASAHEVADLTAFGTSLAELRPLLRFVYTGSLITNGHHHATPDLASPEDLDLKDGDASAVSDLQQLDPSLAFALLPHASALLMDDLKRLCEACLVGVCDEDNAAALQAVAEACFAEKLRVTCVDVLSEVK